MIGRFLLVITAGLLVGGASIACGGDTVTYKDCGDPGPHRFIVDGEYRTTSQTGIVDGPPTASTSPKTFFVDGDSLAIEYTNKAGVEVVESWKLEDRRSNEE